MNFREITIFCFLCNGLFYTVITIRQLQL